MRTIQALAAVVIVVTVVLHAPWSGYAVQQTPDKVDTLTLLARCPGIARGSAPDESNAELLRRFDENMKCAMALQPVAIPLKITRWRSRSPLVYAFGRLRNVAAGIVMLLLITLVATWIGRRFRPGTSTR